MPEIASHRIPTLIATAPLLKSQHLSLYIYETPNGFLKLARSHAIEPGECLFL